MTSQVFQYTLTGLEMKHGRDAVRFAWDHLDKQAGDYLIRSLGEGEPRAVRITRRRKETPPHIDAPPTVMGSTRFEVQVDISSIPMPT